MRHAASKVDKASLAGTSADRPLLRNDPGPVCGHAVEEAAHLALFYESDQQFVDGVMSFIGPGLERGEPVAVAVPPPRVDLLLDELGDRRAMVQTLDMLELGRNPARIIPAVLTMLERHGGRMLRYVGEPVWPGRTPAEVQEAIRHEALINLAWPGAEIRVLCPYDAVRLPEAVLRDAEMTHPWIVRGGGALESGSFGGSRFPAGTDNALPEPPGDAVEIDFRLEDLGAVRQLVHVQSRRAGLGHDRTDDLVIAVNEVATNAIKYGHAGGRLRIWSAGGHVVCQLEDPGHITDPLAGRHRPIAGTEGGIGLWMVNQLCDLVEVRTTAGGTTVRLHVRLR